MTEILPTIIMFVEGTLLPSREGATRRFIGTARNLAAVGHRIVIIHCYRGWSDLSLIGAERFTTYALTPDVFYGDTAQLASIVASERAAIVQFSEIETLCSIGMPLKRLVPNIQLAYECHDIHSDFLSSLGAPTSKIHHVGHMEHYALPICDLIVCFTQEDMKALLKRGAHQDRLFVVPFGIEIEETEAHGCSAGRQIVFVGNMYHRPNQTSVKFIVRELAPSMRALGVPCAFIIIGDCPGGMEADLCDDDVRFVGTIQHLADFLPQMTLAVAPITEGSGIKVKMLDYFAAGLPTIGTSMAFRGYSQSAGIVIDDLKDIPQTIAGLIDDKQRLCRMSSSARLVAESQDWKKIRQQLSRIYLETSRHPLSIRDYLITHSPAFETGTPYVLEDNIAQARFCNAVYPVLAKGSILKIGGSSSQ